MTFFGFSRSSSLIRGELRVGGGGLISHFISITTSSTIKILCPTATHFQAITTIYTSRPIETITKGRKKGLV